MPPVAIEEFARKKASRLAGRIRLFRILAGMVFVATLAATLVAGLWPFSAPANDAQWVAGTNAIQFGENGTALSGEGLRLGEVHSCSVEVQLAPALLWTTGTPLAFYDSVTKREFSIIQDYADLLLRLADESDDGTIGPRFFRIRDVFRNPGFLLTLTSDGTKTSVYVDGHLAANSPNFGLTGDDLSGRIILGNSARRDDSWEGKIGGLAVYGAALAPQQVEQHAREWRSGHEPIAVDADRLAALYLFREGSGRVIHESRGAGPDLGIPPKFTTIDHLRFQRVASEMQADGSYAKDAAINVAGFIPLGFISVLFFDRLSTRRWAATAAVLLGVVTSVAIEYFQSYLPTRYSGVTDIITNSLGTCLGVLVYWIAARLLAKKIRIERSSAQPG